MLKKFALIVAGGSGSRMNQDIPKQFLGINGKPVLMHTFDAFLRFDPAFSFILVLPENQIGLWEALCRQHQFSIPHQIAFGGSVRFDSVKNGLDRINEDGIVFIHDGVRPLVSEQTLKKCLDTATSKGNALPVIPVSESVRRIDGEKSTAVDRSKYFLVQTPQTFRTTLIKTAYLQPYSERFTDDAAVLENTGSEIYTVEGNRENIKITYPEDLKFAAILLDR